MKPQKRKLKLTGWYSGVNPMKSRPGWYEIPLDTTNWQVWWTGQHWETTPGGYVFQWPTFPWRGLSR